MLGAHAAVMTGMARGTPPTEVLKDTFTDTHGTLYSNHTPDIGPRGVYNHVYNVQLVPRIYNNVLDSTYDGNICQGYILFPTGVCVATKAFDLYLECAYPWSGWGNTPDIRAYGCTMAGVISNTNYIYCACPGFAGNIAVAHTMSNTRYAYRMTYDGSDFKFYYKGNLIKTYNNPGLTLDECQPLFYMVRNASYFITVDNYSLYIHGLRP